MWTRTHDANSTVRDHFGIVARVYKVSSIPYYVSCTDKRYDGLCPWRTKYEEPFNVLSSQSVVA